jgi:hypothetical protein
MNHKKVSKHTVPQLRVRTDLTAGQSVENCYANIIYWRDTLEGKCAKKKALYSLY